MDFMPIFISFVNSKSKEALADLFFVTPFKLWFLKQKNSERLRNYSNIIITSVIDQSFFNQTIIMMLYSGYFLNSLDPLIRHGKKENLCLVLSRPLLLLSSGRDSVGSSPVFEE